MLEINEMSKDVKSLIDKILASNEKEVLLKPTLENFKDSSTWAEFIRLADKNDIYMEFKPCRKLSAKSKEDTLFSYAAAECRIKCHWGDLRKKKDKDK